MRWLFGGATALFLIWAGYVASPYIALLRLASAVASADVAQIEDRINARALRVSLAKQIVAYGLTTKAAGALGSDADLAKTTIAVAADPFLAAYVTPENVTALLTGIEVERLRGKGMGVAGRIAASARTLATLIGNSRWRGFRNFYFTLRPGRGAPDGARLQLRLSRLHWRLVGIDLPASYRQTIAEALLRSKDLDR